MNLSNQSLSEAIAQSQKDKETQITDKDIEDLTSLEIPELNQFLNATILLTKQTRNPSARKALKNRNKTKKRI